MNFDLSTIAAKLESLEETIIFRIIDRSQYRRNTPVYEAERFNFQSASNLSLLDHKLSFAESTDAVLGRYRVAEERPFMQNTDWSQCGQKKEGLTINSYNCINLTEQIRESYSPLLEKICLEGDDGEYGTTAEADIALLQALSRRIHFGTYFVAESKFRLETERYSAAIRDKNCDLLMEYLTRKEVEENILERIREKTEHIQKISNPLIRHIIDPTTVVNYYKEVIIPLTKDGEVAYLLQRLA